MPETVPDAPRSPLRRLLGLLRPDRGDIGSVVVFSVLSGALLLATPVAVQALVNNVAFGATAPSIAILAGLLFLGLALGAVVVAVQTWIVEILQRRVFVRLVADLSERLRRIRWEVRDRHYNPELVNRFFDVVTIQKAASTLLLDGIGTVLSIVVGLVVIAFYHPLFLVMDALLLGGVLLLFFAPFRAAMRSAIKESSAKYAVAAWLEEIARHPLTFRLAGSEAWARTRSIALAEEYVASRRRHYRIVFSQIVGALALQVATGTAVLGLGGWLVVKGELTLGQLVAAELIVTVVVAGVAKLGKHAENAYDLLAAVEKVGHLTDLDTEGSERGVASTGAADGPVSLEVRDLPLPALGTRRGQAVSFRVEPGGSLVITGPNGVGKTFVLEALYGLRHPASGSVVFDGVHLADVRLGDLRRQAVLASEPELLEATIEDNLVLGREDVGSAEVGAVLRAVGLSDELLSLPDGLQTRVMPTGAPLSPGQASRLVIARALLAKPRLLLVDRLVDGLSERGRRSVLDALAALRNDCTLVLVTNDESIADRFDQRLDLTLDPIPVP